MNRVCAFPVRSPLLHGLVCAVALFLAATGSDAQVRRPVTTHPGRPGPCKEDLRTTVTKGPWKLSGLGFLTSRDTPWDTNDIKTAAAKLYTAVNGNLGNMELVIAKGMEQVANTFVLYGEYTRTVTVRTTGTKCVNGQAVAVNDVRTYDETSGWLLLWGPVNWVDATPRKLKELIEKRRALLPK